MLLFYGLFCFGCKACRTLDHLGLDQVFSKVPSSSVFCDARICLQTSRCSAGPLVNAYWTRDQMGTGSQPSTFPSSCFHYLTQWSKWYPHAGSRSHISEKEKCWTAKPCNIKKNFFFFLANQSTQKHCLLAWCSSQEDAEEVGDMWSVPKELIIREMCACSISHVWPFLTLRTVAHQAPLSMGFSRQEYWSGLPYPPPGSLLYSGIESMSPASQVDSSLLSHPGSPLGRWN